MPEAERALAAFHPRVRAWFTDRFGAPTDVQARAWPRIAAGEHLLATAPTGSGKTLTAFLWAIDRLLGGHWGAGRLRVLYVSPMKALNNDIRRNLLGPLKELDLPHIGVAVRSGDSTPAERRRLLRRPPEILVTTPESLNLLLSSHGGRAILGDLETVILDEIHAVAGSKRGAWLMAAVERLVPLAGEFQRLALSATVRPPETVATFVGGTGRRVGIVASPQAKRVELAVCAVARGEDEASVWPALAARLRALVDANRATLLFVNNRALCERLTRWLNEGRDEPVAYSHHGSLSREVRTLVEGRLKEGRLKAIVATSSLELGIDIGSLDEVVLVQAPRTLQSAVQRVGRAGHGVGEVSRGRLFPIFSRDYLDAAVLAPLAEERWIEPVRPVRNPLDVLAQVIVSMCGVEEWDLDDLYALLTRAYPFAELRREAFDRVVAMLRGRYAGARLRELKPRLRIDPETGRARGADGVLPLLWRSGGVIPDRGYYTLRVEGGGRLGELDEEFVWERRVGHEFPFGAQQWRVTRITANEVLVAPGAGIPGVPPFWKAESQPRDWELCEKLGAWLERADADPGDATLWGAHVEAEARDAVRDLLARQKEATGRPLPHRHHVLLEECADATAGRVVRRLLVHAPWGERVLRPWAVALSAAWEERHGYELETLPGDDGIALQLPEGVPAREIVDLVAPERLGDLLRRRLERTGLFGTRFRENAARALLLPRFGAGRRTPLWLDRQRAQKLLQAVSRWDDFPIVAETWRTCLEDEFDLPRLQALLEELRDGTIRVSEARTGHPSPFAQGLAWRATNQLMYDQNERAAAGGPPALADRVLREVLHDAALRPRIDPALVAELEGKLQRTAEGYAPVDAAAWVDCVAERLLVRPWTDALPPGVARVAWGGGWAVPEEERAALEEARAGDDARLAGFLARLLQTHGPVTAASLAARFEVAPERIVPLLEELVGEGALLADRFTRDAAATEYCDAENLERLLRMQRAAARPVFDPLPKERLAWFLAAHQGVGAGGGEEELRPVLESLFGFPAAAPLWEEALFPARCPGYRPAWLDTLLQESDLAWFGAGERAVAFAFAEEIPLFLPPAAPDGFLPARGRYEFFEVQQRAGLDSAATARRLWELTWKGQMVNDTMAALRRGVETGFAPVAAAARRRGFRRWQGSRPFAGTWRALARPAADALDEAERDKDRARQLLARYGVLCRELCAAELPLLGWGRLQKALRLLELAGEAVAGRFFAGVSGLQFASPAALRRLRGPGPGGEVFWLNACDPASLCGTGLLEGLPPRVASTWLVYRGDELVLVARRGGAEVECRVPPEPPFLRLFGALLGRAFRPPARVVVEAVDGVPAARSPHAAAFGAAGFYEDMDKLVLERRHGSPDPSAAG